MRKFFLRCFGGSILENAFAQLLWPQVTSPCLSQQPMRNCLSIRAIPQNTEKSSAVQESHGCVVVLGGRQPACASSALPCNPCPRFPYYELPGSDRFRNPGRSVPLQSLAFFASYSAAAAQKKGQDIFPVLSCASRVKTGKSPPCNKAGFSYLESCGFFVFFICDKGFAFAAIRRDSLSIWV